MRRKVIIFSALILFSCLALTGCFGGTAPQTTIPPQETFGSAAEFADAVAKAKADTSAADTENLKGLVYYYGIQTVPDNAVISSVIVSTEVVRVHYTYGPVSEDTFDNQIEIGWYRVADAGNFINQISQSMTDSGVAYDTITAGETTYLHIIPTVSLIVTPSPGDTAVATPTPKSSTYCQIVYWVQDGAAFVAAAPLGFTKDEIGKYCQGTKIELK